MAVINSSDSKKFFVGFHLLLKKDFRFEVLCDKKLSLSKSSSFCTGQTKLHQIKLKPFQSTIKKAD